MLQSVLRIIAFMLPMTVIYNLYIFRFQCKYMQVAYFHGNHSILVNTTFPTRMKIRIKNDSNGWQVIC
jgi:hypothetical protein